MNRTLYKTNILCSLPFFNNLQSPTLHRVKFPVDAETLVANSKRKAKKSLKWQLAPNCVDYSRSARIRINTLHTSPTIESSSTSWMLWCDNGDLELFLERCVLTSWKILSKTIEFCKAASRLSGSTYEEIKNGNKRSNCVPSYRATKHR